MGIVNTLSKVSLIMIVLMLLLPALAVSPASAGRPDTWNGLGDPTKIAPTKAEAPHPFTIIDTPTGRITDGCKAVFKSGGAETVIDLDTHRPFTTAKGALPENIAGGDYLVFCRLADGSEFEIGPFEVIGEPVLPSEPSVSPTSAYPADPFTITDPQGRMESGDIAVFYVGGSDPATGNIATNIVVSTDGTTLSGNVPGGMSPGTYYISVQPTIDSLSRFGDLEFYVQA